MRSLIVILAVIWGGAVFADTVVNCRQAPAGIYPNNANVRALEFISYVDHFSLANMLAMRIESDAGKTTYAREWMRADRNTQMRFDAKRQGKNLLSWVSIDRTPRQVINTRTFVGVLFVSEAVTEKVDQPNQLPAAKIRSFNFECSY